MASVAAAINRASSSKVDAALWWSPHGALLARLEAIDSGETDSAAGDDGGGDGGRDLVRSLSEHHTWLLHGLARFKPPSSRSRDAIGAARLEAAALYREERQNLLKCVRLLLVMQAAAVVLDIVTLVQELFFGFPPSAPLSPAPYSISPSSSSSSSSSSASLASLAISAASESLLSTALHRAVLLLIAAVNVEGAVVALAQGEKFSASSHPLSSPLL
ncbi:hypothetical protein CLOM_g2983 [Closterium sp. NIES-68]|nr:hypothetical protein CLOM_g2983 [Closterium sp. NIES-68]